MWGVPGGPGVPAPSLADPGRVIATVYEIGGPLTGVLSSSVAKQLPLIPHIGIRCHGTEYFYSDHIEYRTVPVMEEMLGDRPQVSIDLGPAAQSEEEVRATLAELDAEWRAATTCSTRTASTSPTSSPTACAIRRTRSSGCCRACST